jgi:lantibiotic biosynthesis protein
VESLTHMQCNRLLGAGRPREQRCHDLWALAHRAINLRPGPTATPTPATT